VRAEEIESMREALAALGHVPSLMVQVAVSNAIFPSPNRVPRFPTGSVMAA
jgi:hypothetical protein